jgi:hypothetical protein
MAEPIYTVDVNPAYPGKGELRFVIYRNDYGTRVIHRQCRTLKSARRRAYLAEVAFERRRKKIETPYLGD